MRLAGSPFHPRDTEDATAALLYAALVSEAYLPPANHKAPFKFGIRSHPTRDATVEYNLLDGGETERADDMLKAQLAECERVRDECKRTAGL